MAYSVMTDKATGDLITEAEWDKIKGNFDAAFPLAPDTAWDTWSPTLANVTVGNGTTTAVYKRVGRFIWFYLKFKMGSTSAMGTGPTFTLPVTAATRYVNTGGDNYGHAQILDSGTAVFGGTTAVSSTTIGILYVWNSAGTYLTANQPSATVPMTWTTNDEFCVIGFYESAA